MNQSKPRPRPRALLAGLLSGVGALFLLTGAKGSGDVASCLPEGIKSDDVVMAPSGKPHPRTEDEPTVTVREALKAAGARCRKGKLVDSKGKEIRFFRLAGCWGNPPADYREILQHQEEELARLKKEYRVMEMPCSPAARKSIV